MSDVDWASIVFHPKTGCFERLKQRACRRFCDVTFGEEAFDFAIEILSRDNWKRLSGFKGKSKPETYLTTIFNNLLVEFFRKRYPGQARAPAWLQALGDSAVRVFELLCKQRLEPETIVDWMCARGEHREEWVREHIVTIKRKVPDCGRPLGPVTMAEVPERPEPGGNPGSEPEVMSEQERREALMLALSALLDNSPDETPPGPGPASEALGQRADDLREALAMTDEERLLLKLIFGDGRKVAASARVLGMAEHTARRQLPRLLKRIASALDRFGLDPESMRRTDGG